MDLKSEIKKQFEEAQLILSQFQNTENFEKIEADKKVLLLGGMMELGNESITEHQAIVDLLNNYNWLNVVLVGGDFNKITHPYIYFDNASQAKEWLVNKKFVDTYFLIKGSRSMQMEKVLA